MTTSWARMNEGGVAVTVTSGKSSPACYSSTCDLARDLLYQPASQLVNQYSSRITPCFLAKGLPHYLGT